MLLIKNIIFWIVFILVTLVYSIGFFIMVPFPPRIRHHIGVSWARTFLRLLKYIIGLDYKVEGLENIPDKPTIICSKHQSGYETLALQMFLPHQVFIIKRELLFIPLIGICLLIVNAIPIDRKNKEATRKKLKLEGLDRKNKGFWINIFPEGTRTLPGVRGEYKLGAANMAINLKMDILPIATNSGEFWPKKNMLRYPGTISFIIGKPILWDSGDAVELTKKCADWIEKTQLQIQGIGPCFPKKINKN